MTERQLRRFLADTAAEYYGINEDGEKHKEIIKIYNAIRPLPQGYALKSGDSWCTAFVSAAAAKCSLLDIIPAECSCLRQISAWQGKGRWKEDDAYIPDVGDFIYYDWQDDGKGDNKGVPDHVGIVTEVSGKSITVIEGNVSDSVKYRHISANAKNIRGYGLPDFASKTKEDESLRYKTIKEVPAGAYRDEVEEFVEPGPVKGRSDGTLTVSKLIEKLKAFIK